MNEHCLLSIYIFDYIYFSFHLIVLIIHANELRYAFCKKISLTTHFLSYILSLLGISSNVKDIPEVL